MAAVDINSSIHLSIIPMTHREAGRLEQLRRLGVLDTGIEAFSQSVAAAAATIANVPISAISLVDRDRQWFKGSCGLDVSETPVDVSFCAHAIRDTEPLIIEDASSDPRFMANPLVLGPPYIRFYAGFPLVVRGAAVGALCVIDDLERSLSPEQRGKLTELAHATGAWLTSYSRPE